MLKVAARAKVNWSLDILGVLENGYHRMDMLMSNVSLADELLFSRSDTLSLTVEGNPQVPVKDNLVLKAAEALRKHTGYTGGAAIALHKHIPHGAGLGGGSADAAAALKGLNTLWNLQLDEQTLHSLAASLGADIPFFLTGGFARIQGFGEQVLPLPPLSDIPLVILQPCSPQPTKEVFTLYDALVTISHPDTDGAQAALLKADLDALSKTAGNVLQQALEPKKPQLTEALAALDACDAAFTTMTGSGSAVFGAFKNEAAAKAAHRILRRRWKKCWLSHSDIQSIMEE